MKKHIDRRLVAAIEHLEPRRMLAVFNGTNANDIIEISATSSTTTVRINGVANTTSDTQIDIRANDGHDTFRVLSTRAGVTINAFGGRGEDILVNPTTLDLDVVYAGVFIFKGGPDFDSVIADNSQDSTTPANIDITNRAIRKNGLLSVDYDEIEFLSYRDSNGSNRIGFINMNIPGSDIGLQIFGNGGNDVIANTISIAPTPGHWGQSIGTGGLFIDGGAGTDTLQFANGSGFGGTWTFSLNTIEGPALGLVTYFNTESIDMVGSPSGETVNLRSKPSAVSFKFDAGNGDDLFLIGNGDLDSNGWRATTILGGSGNDIVIFEDQLDTDAAGETENYTWSSGVLSKGSMTINYSGFVTQSLRAANGIDAGQFPTTPVVNLSSTANTITFTDIQGAPLRGTIANVGNGDLATINGRVRLFQVHTSNVNDQNAGGLVNAYEVNSSQVRRIHTDLNDNQTTHLIDHSGVTQMTLNTSNILDAITINQTPPNLMLTVNGNGGNDIFTFGEGDISTNFGGPVVLNGGAGTDSLTIANGSDAALATQTLTGDSFTDGFTHTYSGFESLTINEGPGGTSLAVNSLSIPTTINGGSGEDTFTVGGGDIDDNIPASTTAAPALIINGGSGNDFILFNDLNDTITNFNQYTFERPGGIDQLRKTDQTDHVIRWGNIEQVTLDASNLNNRVHVVDVATSLRIITHGGNDLIQVDDSAVPVFVHTGDGSDSLSIAQDDDQIPATVVIDQSDVIGGLGVSRTGTLRVTDGAVLNISQAAFLIAGTLDLSGGALLCPAGFLVISDLRAKLITGRNGGSWDGIASQAGGAIQSSLATATPFADGIGYGLGSELAITSIGPFSIQPDDLLLRYTLDGDADLNQQVNLADFNRLASNFGQSSLGWAQGDSNYDGSVNLADFNSLAGNFGQAIAAPSVFGQERIRDTSDSDDRGQILEELT